MKKFIKLFTLLVLAFVLVGTVSCNKNKTNKYQTLINSSLNTVDNYTIYYKLSKNNTMVYDLTESLTFNSGYAIVSITEQIVNVNFEYDKNMSSSSEEYKNKTEYLNIKVSDTLAKKFTTKENGYTATLNNDEFQSLINNDKFVTVTDTATVDINLIDNKLANITINYASSNDLTASIVITYVNQ